MPVAARTAVPVLRDQEIPTWFKVGGRADRMARPADADELRACVELDPDCLILGDGANLLVDDEGVGELVVRTDAPALSAVRIDAPAGLVVAGAGAKLPRLVNECVRRGLAGLENLGGIPASIGGAVRMNAGGAFGQIADVVERVHAVDRSGAPVTRERDQIDFGYRRSGLEALIIVGVELRLPHAEPGVLRRRLLEIMEYKSRSQPLGASSAGCLFKNPTLTRAVEGIGMPGQRVSAGLLIDRAGCKGLAIDGAEVSPVHGNFFVSKPAGRAADVLRLMEHVRRRVLDRFGVDLEPEVVIWRRR